MNGEKISPLDEALFKLSALEYRSVLKELAQLARFQIRALAYRGIKGTICKLEAKLKLVTLSNSAHAVLEAALKE